MMYNPELDEILSRPTYYEQEEYIDLMTMIDGFICKKDTAIIVSSDGREANKSHTEVNDKAEKIYELSSQCVVMFSGSVPATINERMALRKECFEDCHIVDVTTIADRLVTSFRRSDEKAGGKLDTLIALVAGYDGTSNAPSAHLYVIYRDKHGSWDKHATGTLYLHAGEAFHAVAEVLKCEFDPDADLETMNKLALKTIRVASEDKPESTGGQPILWNLRPHEPIKKFTPEEINTISNSNNQ